MWVFGKHKLIIHEWQEEYYHVLNAANVEKQQNDSIEDKALELLRQNEKHSAQSTLASFLQDSIYLDE